MPVDHFDTGFNSLPPPEFMLTMNNFADSLLTHAFFKDNWPDWLTHPTALKQKVVGYNESLIAYDADGGRKNLQIRDERRQDVHISAVFMSQYVVMRAFSENQLDWLKSIALKEKTRVAKASSKGIQILSAPGHLTVDHFKDKTSGALVVSYSKVAFAGTYEIQVCEGDPTVESNWRSLGHYGRCRVEFTGMEPGKRLYFRVRCHGTGEAGAFTPPVSIIVI